MEILTILLMNDITVYLLNIAEAFHSKTRSFTHYCSIFCRVKRVDFFAYCIMLKTIRDICDILYFLIFKSISTIEFLIPLTRIWFIWIFYLIWFLDDFTANLEWYGNLMSCSISIDVTPQVYQSSLISTSLEISAPRSGIIGNNLCYFGKNSAG